MVGQPQVSRSLRRMGPAVYRVKEPASSTLEGTHTPQIEPKSTYMYGCIINRIKQQLLSRERVTAVFLKCTRRIFPISNLQCHVG